MFPYPSGDKLHLGHWYNYAPMDTYVRYLRYQSVDVRFPMGFDSFGLPAEQYAIKTGIHPSISIRDNIEKMKEQFKVMNCSFDPDYLVTSDPSYYKWTQWLFSIMHSSGLAHKKISPVNYCDTCGTVLANEQCKNGICERCDSKVAVRELNQWFFKITEYKDRLIKGLDAVAYPEKTKAMQLHWLKNLKDWCVSRQRYWGAPVPVVYDEEGKPFCLDQTDLPWLLPKDVDFSRKDCPPLATSQELKDRVIKEFGEGWTPDTDTLDTFVCSSFYYLRYFAKDPQHFCDIHESGIKDWMPVKLYVGGPEHACAHLIYARFINMVLFDQGYSPVEEPFEQVYHQGMITRNGAKMSKSKGNAVDPADLVEKYGSDTLRMFLMFMGPYDQGGDWSDKGIVGIVRFFEKSRVMVSNARKDGEHVSVKDIDKALNDIGKLKFNTSVAAMMTFVKKNWEKPINVVWAIYFAQVLSLLAPEEGMRVHGMIGRVEDGREE